MRVAGYLLLILGLFAMACSHYVRLHGAKGRAASFAFQSMTEAKTQDSSELREIIRRSLDEMGRNMPSIPVAPAIMMVAGAVLLDIAGRWNKKARKG